MSGFLCACGLLSSSLIPSIWKYLTVLHRAGILTAAAAPKRKRYGTHVSCVKHEVQMFYLLTFFPLYFLSQTQDTSILLPIFFILPFCTFFVLQRRIRISTAFILIDRSTIVRSYVHTKESRVQHKGSNIRFFDKFHFNHIHPFNIV